MVKKISALVLALVLCLSVVVVPVNAAKVEIGDNIFAIAFEWDKTSYSAGDTAYLSVYADGHDDYSFYTGTITFGLNSNVFDPGVHTTAYLKENTTTADWFNTYYKAAADGAISQLATSVTTNVNAANTAEEQALYDWYVKIGLAKNSAGSHENVGTTKAGFGGADFNPDEPIMVIALTVKEDVADGTAVSAAITSGTFLKPSTTSPSTGIKYYKTPGEATTTANVATSSIDITKADTTETTGDVTIGAATIVNPLKGQMRYDTKDSLYDVRALAEIKGADFVANFGADGSKIVDIGFVFTAGSNVSKDAISMDTVKNIVEKDGTADHYTKKPVKYISTSISEGNYVFSCIVENIDATTAASAETLVAVAYVEYTDADGKTAYAYYDGAQEISYSALYNSNNNTHK